MISPAVDILMHEYKRLQRTERSWRRMLQEREALVQEAQRELASVLPRLQNVRGAIETLGGEIDGGEGE